MIVTIDFWILREENYIQWILFIYFCFGHSGGLNPARIRILPKSFFVPGILNNIQQIRQNVFSSYHQDRYRYLRCVFLAQLILLPTLASMGRI